MVTAVGFDLDGTLFDHEGAARSAIDGFLAEHGWNHPGDAGLAWLQLEEIHFREFADGSISFQDQRHRRMQGLVASLGLDAGASDIDALFVEYLAHYRRSWIPFPDVTGTLAVLRSMGLSLAVLTNGDQAQQEDKLRQMGILDEFTVVLAGSSLPAFKPSAVAFETLCSALGRPAADVLYVGDDLAVDVHGALDAGLRSVWINRRGRAGGYDEVPTIASLDELPAHLPSPVG